MLWRRIISGLDPNAYKGGLIYAFDIDGTLTRHTRELRECMRCLRLGGNAVAVLTGKETPTEYSQEENPDRPYRVLQLSQLGIYEEVHFDHLLIACGSSQEAVGVNKASILRELKAHIFIDDSKVYIKAVREHCPEVACLWVAD